MAPPPTRAPRAAVAPARWPPPVLQARAAAPEGRRAPHPPVLPVARIPPGGHAPHVQAALAQRSPAWPIDREPPTEGIEGEFVTYEDRKTRGGPVPPPRRPVYVLLSQGDGTGCRLQSVETGRIVPAGTLFAGFVRMSRNGPVYLSPRQSVELPGDSHPSIAAATLEGRSGRKQIVAAGEVGIVDGVIVGHNDKTGHYQTRRNAQQSGLPTGLFHPYTVHPREWFKR